MEKKTDEDSDEDSDEDNNILAAIRMRLPEVLVDCIASYIPLRVWQWTSRRVYLRAHRMGSPVPAGVYESFLRDMVRKDCDFVFATELRRRGQVWLHQKRYVYKQTIYANYVSFLKDYCLEHGADRCLRCLQDCWDEWGLSQNESKKKRIHSRWRMH